MPLYKFNTTATKRNFNFLLLLLTQLKAPIRTYLLATNLLHSQFSITHLRPGFVIKFQAVAARAVICFSNCLTFLCCWCFSFPFLWSNSQRLLFDSFCTCCSAIKLIKLRQLTRHHHSTHRRPTSISLRLHLHLHLRLHLHLAQSAYVSSEQSVASPVHSLHFVMRLRCYFSTLPIRIRFTVIPLRYAQFQSVSSTRLPHCMHLVSKSISITS